MPATTPDDLAIVRRDYQFGRDEAHPRWWHNNDPVATAFYNSLSALFPLGERFFMDSVKAFRDKTDGKLRQQVADFLYQEAMHTREHVVFNKMAANAGYDVARLEGRAALFLGFARKQKPIRQLAVTTALEHFTAMLAAAVLEDRRHFAGAPKEAEDMWLWHAMEEVEHKAVAFDTYLAATKHWPGAYAWFIRSVVMVVATVLFFWAVTLNVRDHFREDGVNDGKHWRRLARYLFVEPGLLRAVLKSYFRYYKPGFHPWQEDDSALLRDARTTIVRPAPAAA